MKHIIEIEDEPFVRLSALFGEEGLYRAKGFKSIVFDQSGLDKLTPLDKELDEAYQNGVHDGSLDVKQRVDGAYQKGYEVGQHEATTLEYQQGLNDAWECARKIAHCALWGAYQDETDASSVCAQAVLDYYSASEAMEKIQAYEQQKADAEIKVGDEVCFVFAGGETIEPFIVFSIKDDNGKKYYEGIQTSDGRWVSGGLKYYKTGRHFPQVAELLEAMKDEQRICSTCKYSDEIDVQKCSDCFSSKGYNKWEPKEGAE